MSFYGLYALLTAGFVLTLWGSTVRNTGGIGSLIVVKIFPAALGVWCLWEAALIVIADSVK